MGRMRLWKFSSHGFFVAMILFSLCTGHLHALEIDGVFHLGNLGFAQTRASTDASFTGADFFWGGALSVVQDISESFLVEVGTYRDLILGNTLTSSFKYRTDYFTLGIGTYLGFFNSTSYALKSGVSTDVQLELPGIVIMSVHTENSLGSTLRDLGDYIQTRNAITLGFYVFNAICTLSMDSKEFSLNAGALQTVDGLTDYSFRIQVYEKNVPLRFNFAFSYQILSKEFIDGATNPVHTLNSLVLGTGLDLIFSGTFDIFVDFSASVYTWGSGQLAGFSVMGFQPFLFQGSTGFRLSFPASKDPSAI